MSKARHVFIALFFMSGCMWAHPLKLSTCWIVQEDNEILLTFNFFADDFEDALKGVYGDFINLEKFDPKTEKKVLRYIEQNFTLKIDGKKCVMQAVGHSLKKNIFRVKFRIDKRIEPDIATADILIVNKLLLKEIAKQSNIVRIDLKGDGNYRSLEFKKAKETHRFIL